MKKRCVTTQITAAKETNDEHVGRNSRQLAEGQEQNHPMFSVTITLFYFSKKLAFNIVSGFVTNCPSDAQFFFCRMFRLKV
jgi:hypothetical protein